MDTHGFLLRARLDAKTLEAWIEARWVVPRADMEGRRFAEIDVARAQLIRDLKEDMGVNDEGITIILDLVDQIHGLRGTLHEFLSALTAQPAAMRRRIIAEVRAAAGEAESRNGKKTPGG
jgi:chaperone modulatory protein CbpM